MELKPVSHFVAYSEATDTRFSIKGASSKKASSEEITPPSMSVIKDENKASKVAWWGENNDFPNVADKEIKKNPTLTSALRKKVEYLYTQGIEFYKEKIIDNKFVIIPVSSPELNAIKNAFQTKQYLAQSVFDYTRYYSFFPEIIFSLDKSKALYLTAQKAVNTRWGKQNESTGLIELAYINSNWAEGRKEDSPDTIIVSVLDPFVHSIDAVKLDTANLKYIFWPHIASSETYYPLVDWWSVKESGWLDISNYIPTYKKSLMLRSMSAEWHIEVHIGWLKEKYGETWAKATPEMQNQIFLDEINHFNQMRMGPDKAGGNVMSTKFWDEESQTLVSAWTFNDLSQSNKSSGEYIQDSNEADQKIHYAVGLDSTTTNTSAGGGLGDGSGSNKKEAFNMVQSTKSIHEEIILSPILWMINYNGLNPDNDIQIRFKTPILQTMNNVPPSQRDTTQTPTNGTAAN